MIQLQFEAKGYRDAQGRFAKRTEELAMARREIVWTEGREMTKALRKHAPKSSGVFARGIIYVLQEGAQATTLSILSTGRHAFLLPFIVHGTRPHQIPRGGSAAQLAKGYPLRFYWEKGPKGPGIYYFWSVNHPGTKPNPFIDRALAERQPIMAANVQKMATKLTKTRQFGRDQ